MAVHKTQQNAFTDMVTKSVYGIDTMYDGGAGGMVNRVGVGKIEAGPTTPKAKIPTVSKVEVAAAEADIPVAMQASSVNPVALSDTANRELTGTQLKRLVDAKERVSAYIAKARGAQ